MDAVLLVALVVALLSAVFLALAEASLLRIGKFRVAGLAQEGDRSAVRVSGLLERLPEVLNLILFLALLSQVGAATLTGVLAARQFGSVGVTIASAVLTLLLFIYGEAIPKTYAVRHAERAALLVSGPIAFLDRVLTPVVKVLVWFADIQLPGKGINASPAVTEEELRLLAGEAALEGEITGQDHEMIERAFTFGDRRADDIMVPRLDIVAVSADTPIDDSLELALDTGHRRLPVYTDSLDHIIGVARLRDLLRAQREGIAALETVIESAPSVPESVRISTLLEEMQRSNTHVAIVVDEYGGTAGLVTIEDIAEELLGTITYDQSSDRLREIGTDRWLAPGSLPAEDLSTLSITVPEGDWNTVAGLMLAAAGKLLTEGDAVVVDGYTFTVESLRGRRILRVVIDKADRQ